MLLKTTLTFNRGNQGVAMNVFYHTTGANDPAWSITSAVMTTYIENVYGPIQTIIVNDVTFVSCTVEQVAADGTILGLLGSITPSVAGSSSDDMNSGPTAMTIGARTLVPKVRGSKRFAGIAQGYVVDQLLANSALVALAAAAANYIQVYSSGGVTFTPGVISSQQSGFVPFSQSGAWAKNIPGTQVTRKPGRGI